MVRRYFALKRKGNNMHTENGMTFFFTDKDVLSNWYPVTFKVNGIVFNCTEQYMMYCKAKLFDDHDTAKKILDAQTPREHKALGRSVKGFDDKVWKEMCQQFVFNGCYAKFVQNLPLLKVLLDTGETELVEASPYDKIWGVGLASDEPRILNKENWRGLNLLGIVLMNVRTALANANNQAYVVIEANNLTDEFINQIDSKYGVKVLDRSKEPWSVKFVGTRAGLMNMLNDHWYDQYEDQLTSIDAKEIVDIN